MTLKTLTEWLQLLASPERQIESDGLLVNVYGDGDQSYFVIDKQIGSQPRVAVQYVLHPVAGNGLYQQLSFLAESGFDLESVVERLGRADFVVDGMNEIARFAHVEVARYELQENAHHGD